MSSHSIVQDENLAKQFCKTPGTPMKQIHQTPRISNRKRSLFERGSPSNSDDLGPMSPLSDSSRNSFESFESPCFSPNGKFSTPPKTPVSGAVSDQQSRLSTRKMEIKSSLFPNLKIHTPKSQKNADSPRRSPRLTPRKSSANAVTVEDVLRDLTTPPKSAKRARKSENQCGVSEDGKLSSQNIGDSSEKGLKGDATPLSRLGLKAISSESFYGPAPALPKASTQLFIDTLGSKVDNRKRSRSLSLDSTASNRSFVSGTAQKKRKTTDSFSRAKNTRHGRQKGPHVGVWHGVRKPKKMKFAKNYKKPLLSPCTRISKLLETNKASQIQVKSKRLFEEKPRKRTSHNVKKNPEPCEDDDDDDIIDSFPHHLIKRNNLPTSSHPSSSMDMTKDVASPDPNKKFLRYGATRRATFTLNKNLKLQFSGCVMKLQSPKKRRKLYSAKNEMIFDFNDDDEKHEDVKSNIENILTKLQNDSDVDSSQKDQPRSPCKVQLKKGDENQHLDILENPNTIVNLVKLTPRKVLTEIENDASNKLLTNLSSLAINELRDNSFNKTTSEGQKLKAPNESRNESSLESTGILVSSARNILSGSQLSGNSYLTPAQVLGDSDNEKYSQEKLYSLFYKENWTHSRPTLDAVARNSNKKKSIKVPDNQYLLDAGQKSIGIVTCEKCGVMYQAGDFADEATHKNFHNHLPELRFTSWANERVVGKYPDGRVIMIVFSDPKSWWHKVTKIVDIVDQELGFPECSVNAFFYKTVYLYVNEKAKQIVGCLIAEECKKAYKMLPPFDGSDIDSCSKDPSPCKVGISRIWTALNHRRRGVARRMIECLQRSFLYGELVPMDLIAFSVPSPSGKLLAQNVTGKFDFLVYGFA